MSSFRPNAKQWETILDYLENNPELITGRATGPNAKHVLRGKWEELAGILNSLGYGCKSVDKWIKTWTDFKYNLKKKAGDIKKDQSKTGGGSGSQKILSDFEQRALQLMGVGFIGLDVAEVGLLQLKKPNDERLTKPQQAYCTSRTSNSSSTSTLTPETTTTPELNSGSSLSSKENIPNDSRSQSDRNKRKRSNNNNTVEDAYQETIDILNKIHTTIDKHLSDISNSLKIIANSKTCSQPANRE